MNSFRRIRILGLLKLFWLCGCLSLSISCTSTRNLGPKELTGTYSTTVIYNKGTTWYREITTTLKLHPDSTFEYIRSTPQPKKYVSEAGDLKLTSSGTWQFKENCLLLNSTKQPSPDLYEIVKTGTTESDSIKIAILDDELNPLKSLEVQQIKEGITVARDSTDALGEVSFSKVATDEFGILFANLIIKHRIENSKSDSYIFKILVELWIEYRFFINEKWKVENGKLYDPYLAANQYAKTKYLRKINE